ncbi:hypothetical protein [Leptospira levettii]|uniref:ApeA N-terminal domain-containing protein n=1 Tax=Leptospira levettii TaxID=2023178 RepID=A0ABY2MQR9_9LEPT|nr:hypothetical protein [Leptospira levettii]PKA22041.1 hypothetical protein CH381_32940 [Leptospira sp. mixed culture ATI2-C-A1]TGL73144.1 hypothetical protein EHQ60_05800 [Leptospira levettii]
MKQEDQKNEPKYLEVILGNFMLNNPHCEVSFEKNEIMIEKPWGGSDARLQFQSDNTDIIQTLNSTILDPRFDAIIHEDGKVFEFIFSFVLTSSEISKDFLNRSFTIMIEGENYECEFKEPTKSLFNIASVFNRVTSDITKITVPQMRMFTDFQRIDKLTDKNKTFFKDRIPTSFYVKSKESILNKDPIQIFKNINFIMSYYDRRTVTIIIRELEEEYKDQSKKFPRYLKESFPKEISIKKQDEVILKLLEVASETNPRHAFLYYYQVFEYVSYYYLELKIKTGIERTLKDPTISKIADEKINEMITIISESMHNDEVKIRKMIEELVDPEDLWKDIESNKEFFANNVCFDGGLELSPLISIDTTKQTWMKMWMPNLFDKLTKIRNCLVHAREKRENKIILPTLKNSSLLSNYLPIISRCASQVSIYSR